MNIRSLYQLSKLLIKKCSRRLYEYYPRFPHWTWRSVSQLKLIQFLWNPKATKKLRFVANLTWKLSNIFEPFSSHSRYLTKHVFTLLFYPQTGTLIKIFKRTHLESLLYFITTKKLNKIDIIIARAIAGYCNFHKTHKCCLNFHFENFPR